MPRPKKLSDNKTLVELTVEEKRDATPATGALKAIRNKCLDCCNGQLGEVRLCPVVQCPLYLWRFGKRPTTVARINKAKRILKELDEKI